MQTDPAVLEPNEAPAARPTLTAEQPIDTSPAVVPSNEDGTSGLSLQLSPLNQKPAVIDAKALPANVQRHKARRKGRIACLPKLQRDMVNRMITNGVPYKNIVEALDEAGFAVTERNISNWATGGYLEWRFEQDLILQNKLDQDHLVDHLRRDDASELPEVGLQAAATRISQILVQKTASAADVEANLGAFSQMVDVLCRLNREIGVLQKQRDDSRRTLGPAHDAPRIKNEEEKSARDLERFYSDPDEGCGLEKPAVPPLLPPYPTSDTLEVKDLEDKIRRQRQVNQEISVLMKAMNGKKNPSSTEAKPVTPPESGN